MNTLMIMITNIPNNIINIVNMQRSITDIVNMQKSITSIIDQYSEVREVQLMPELPLWMSWFY